MWVLALLCAFNVLSNAGSIVFDPALSMTSDLSADQTKVFFTVTFKAIGWFGFGISLDGSMGSAGFGSDVVVCSQNSSQSNFSVVNRYWVDRYGPPSNGTVVPDSNCTEYVEEAISVMTFTRDVAALSNTQRGFNISGATKLIWAYNEGNTSLSAKHTAQGSIDFYILPPNPPTPAPINGMVQLDSVLSMFTSFVPDSNNVSFTIISKAPGWLGVGVSPDGSMNNGGNGSDVVACSNGTVYRYWITQHSAPTGGVVMEGAACQQTSLGSYIKFSRSLTAGSPTERPINGTGPTTFIWAYSTTSLVLNYHSNRSSVSYDIHAPPGAPTASPSAPSTAAPSPPSTAVPTSAPTPSVQPIQGGAQLDAVYSLKTSLSAAMDQITFTLTSTASGWMGFGVSPSGTMTNNGVGSDVVACSNGVVMRYWVTQYLAPTGGVVVPNATCRQSGGGSYMQFTRLVVATSVTQLPINVTGNTTFIWAYHPTVAVLNQIHTNQGKLIYDVHNPPVVPTFAPTSSPTATGGPVEGNLRLDATLSLKTVLSGSQEEITISIKSSKEGWMAFGVSPNGTMTNAGNGSDVVACSNGTVSRYWVTQYAAPTGGIPVPGATCEQSAGGSSMQFTRSVAALSPFEWPINVTGDTTFIWAYSDSNPVMDSYHTNRSGLVYDVHNPPGKVTAAPTTATPTTTAPSTITPTAAPTISAAPTAFAPTQAGMKFDDVMSGLATVSEDKSTVHFVITATRVAWIGFGVSPNGQMNNGGDGSDVVVCASKTVQRYWVTEKRAPYNGSVILGSSCKQDNGVSTMEFTRDIAAVGPHQRPISLTGPTTFIWAYGSTGNTDLTQIHQEQGSISYDVSTGQGGKVTHSPAAVLWVHMLAMLVAWGALLPFGVTFARYMRKHHDAKLWFTVHRTCQYAGWTCQLLGAVMAIIYIQSNGLPHFSGSNAYHKIIGLITVILGTIQPLNAYFRPHPHPDIDSSRGCDDARTCWEYLHKGTGYLAIALGAFNVFAGVAVAKASEYVAAFWLIPVVIASITIGSMLMFAVYKEICGHGKEDPRPVVGQAQYHRKNSEMSGDLHAQLIPE